MTEQPDPADEFTTHRALLFSIAYEITGSVGVVTAVYCVRNPEKLTAVKV
ncbi:hypothetical protein ACQP1V_41970 [Microtetraspora malaysiensis]